VDAHWSQARLLRTLGDFSSSNGAIFRNLAESIRIQIRAGRIPAGVRLPSERALATALGVSRSTVIAAFDELRADGLIASRQGSGTHVTRAGLHRNVRGENRFDTFTAGSSPTGDQIDLRSAALPGLPFVADEMARISMDAVRDLLTSHGYVPSGLLELRTAIAGYYGDLGLPTDPEEILVTSGAQQGLRLIVSTLLEAGDVVVIEEPTFRGAIETLRSAAMKIIAVPSGRDGIDLAAVRRVLDGGRVRMIFVQASGHNPTGSVLEPAKRSALAALAAAHGVLLVEDAAVLDAAIDVALIPPISGQSDSIVTIGSASKSFWGGLRVGWLRAAPGLIAHLSAAKGSEDLGTSLIAQLLAARLLTRVNDARAERRARLRDARDALLETIESLIPSWDPVVPHAGASLWVRLPRPSATAFTQFAARQRVLLLPGPTFSASEALDDHVRLSFAAPTGVVVDGATRLATVWKRFDN
jgi:DNA-binding transcriptional MocR family regulator